MAKATDTTKILDLLRKTHAKEAEMVGVLRGAGIGETTIARAMKSSPQAIAKRFPKVRTTATRAGITRAVGGRRTATRTVAKRTMAKRTMTPARARGKVGARAR